MFPLRLRRLCRPVATLVCAAALIMVSVGGASAQTVTRNADGTISLSASELPLGQVLRALGSVRPFEKLVVQPSVEAAPVTLSLVNVSVEEALTAVLHSAGVNYVMAGARLVVGDAAMIADAQRKEKPDAVPSSSEHVRAYREMIESPPLSEPDTARDRADQQQAAADLDRVLVSPPGVPAFQAGYAVLPGENGGTTLVPLPIGGARPSGPALPGLGADPTSRPVGAVPSWIPVPPGLQALIGVPVGKPSPPKK